MNIGDILEAGPLLENLSSEQIVLQVMKIHKKEGPEVIELEATYFGVRIGTVTRTTAGDTVTWHWER